MDADNTLCFCLKHGGCYESLNEKNVHQHILIMRDISEEVCKWKILILHFWSWRCVAAHGPFVSAGLSAASVHKRKCLWCYSNRRIKSAVWWLGWHICLAVMKISPLSCYGPGSPLSTSCFFILPTGQGAARIRPLSYRHFTFNSDEYDRGIWTAEHHEITICHGHTNTLIITPTFTLR